MQTSCFCHRRALLHPKINEILWQGSFNFFFFFAFSCVTINHLPCFTYKLGIYIRYPGLSQSFTAICIKQQNKKKKRKKKFKFVVRCCKIVTRKVMNFYIVILLSLMVFSFLSVIGWPYRLSVFWGCFLFHRLAMLG